MRQEVKLSGCDSRQFILLCLNCHLMCMQSGTLSEKDTLPHGGSTTMRCKDKQVGCDQTHDEMDLTNLCLMGDHRSLSLSDFKGPELDSLSPKIK